MARPHGFVTRGTKQNLFEGGCAGIVHQQRGRLAVGGPSITPPHESNERGGEVHTFWRQPVFEAGRTILVLHLVQNVMIDEAAEPIGQEITSDAEIIVELAEAVYASEDISQDQQSPTVANQIQRRLDRTRR